MLLLPVTCWLHLLQEEGEAQECLIAILPFVSSETNATLEGSQDRHLPRLCFMIVPAATELQKTSFLLGVLS